MLAKCQNEIENVNDSCVTIMHINKKRIKYCIRKSDSVFNYALKTISAKLLLTTGENSTNVKRYPIVCVCGMGGGSP